MAFSLENANAVCGDMCGSQGISMKTGVQDLPAKWKFFEEIQF